MDIRSLSRGAAAACLIIGPLALAMPTNYSEADSDGAGQLKVAAAHLGVVHLGNAILIPGMLMVPAMIYIARLARARSPKLAFFGGGLSALAWLSGLIGVGATGLVVYHAVGLADQRAMATLIDRLGNDPIVGTMTLLFVLGHFVGMVLLGIALIRSRAIPVWAGALFTAYPVVHLAAHIAGSVTLDNASGILLVVSAIMAAITVLRTPNQQWDLPVATEAATEIVAEPVAVRS